MHMLSRKDLNSAELESVKVSKNPTTVVAANGEVQKEEEATVCVKGLDLLVTALLLEETEHVLLLWKTLRRSRVFLTLDQRSESTTHQKWQTNKMQHGELRTDRCPRSIDRFLYFIFTYFSYIIAGKRDSHGASSINTKWECEWGSTGKLVAWSARMATGVQARLVDGSFPEHRDASSSSRESASEPRAKVVSGSGKHRICSHITEGQRLRDLQANQNYKGFLQKTHWYSSAQSRNFWWLDHSGSLEETEFVVDSGTCMHMVSKKDLNSAELETMRISRNPSKVMTANGEVLTKAEATVYVKNWIYSWRLCFWKTHLQFFHSGSSAKIMGIHTTGPAVKNHNSPKMARKSIATQRTTYWSLSSLVFRPARQAQLHLHLQHHDRRNHLHEDQDNKGSLQKTHQRSHTSCWKFFWFDNSRSQSS